MSVIAEINFSKESNETSTMEDKKNKYNLIS